MKRIFIELFSMSDVKLRHNDIITNRKEKHMTDKRKARSTARSYLANQSGMTFRDLLLQVMDTQDDQLDLVRDLLIEASEKNRHAYEALAEEVMAIEKEAEGLYLFDGGIDAHNVAPLAEGCIGYWAAMLRAACMAVGMRAEEAGININARLGRSIY